MTRRRPLNASDRVQRLLAIIPWIAANDGPAVAEVCARFDVTQPELLGDLDLVRYVGVYPYTPDQLFDVIVEDGRVWIHLAPSFDHPLRLTPAQALALLAAGESLLDVPGGGDPNGALARGLAKLAAALDLEHAVDVDLGEAGEDTLSRLREAIDAGRQVTIDYYAYGRDERAVRLVDPYRVYNDQGQWYLIGWCHRAGDERLFRLDRIVAAEIADTTFEAPSTPPALAAFEPTADDPRVTIELAPGAGWVASEYPVEGVETLTDGRLRVTLAVGARPWLERLLLRLGPLGRVVGATDPALVGAGAEAARRVLGRYGEGDPTR